MENVCIHFNGTIIINNRDSHDVIVTNSVIQDSYNIREILDPQSANDALRQ